MQFIIKFFPEITIKSKPVRQQFVRQLRDNVRKLLQAVDPEVRVQKEWDKLVVRSASEDAAVQAQMVAVLESVPGIAYFLEVVEYPFVDLHDAFEKTRDLLAEQLAGKHFAVRCKRVGTHDFSSGEAERYIGGGLNQHTEAAGVRLKEPDITVRVEIREDRLYVVNRRYKGIGGFPLGSLDPVMSLISGGFDSTVSSYLTMKRGMRTHFVFFNLGGRDHEIGVKEVAYYLWSKFGASHRVKFVTVPFEEVVAEILRNVQNSQMGVILKRMMLRAASRVAEELGVDALVTGESVAQVSSQTLINLGVIDRVTDSLVLRPLITSDKNDIIDTARAIGTEEFAANMPEYCGVISVKPTTRAKLDKVEAEEARFDFAVLEAAVAKAQYTTIDQLADEEFERSEVEVLPIPLGEAVVVDVRHPDEIERQPLKLDGVEVIAMPFFELHSRFSELDQSKTYQLYCDKGVMSRLHAGHLLEQGYANVKVYRPS